MSILKLRRQEKVAFYTALLCSSVAAFIFFASQDVADSLEQRLGALAICIVIGAVVTLFNHWWFRVWGWHLVPVTLHDALPICSMAARWSQAGCLAVDDRDGAEGEPAAMLCVEEPLRLPPRPHTALPLP